MFMHTPALQKHGQPRQHKGRRAGVIALSTPRFGTVFAEHTEAASPDAIDLELGEYGTSVESHYEGTEAGVQVLDRRPPVACPTCERSVPPRAGGAEDRARSEWKVSMSLCSIFQATKP